MVLLLKTKNVPVVAELSCQEETGEGGDGEGCRIEIWFQVVVFFVFFCLFLSFFCVLFVCFFWWLSGTGWFKAERQECLPCRKVSYVFFRVRR